ncbi:Glutaminyl-tRNA synthetase [Minicystis rosea]|nr:Glutaminyl-tRNA synthetase [Minicystis rosea]
MSTSSEKQSPSTNFIRDMIDAELASGRKRTVVTRFPPEPNGYLHIGHAKSICLNFGLARDYHGVCHLRFDDTNPETEDMEYVESIQRDVRWLGFEWGDKRFFASDYYERLYQYAEQLIKAGKAYVCSLSEEEFKQYRGTAYEPGKPSPYRDRSVEENLDLFRRMRKGEFPDGAHVLRGKIDMASPNMKMRDWPFYRIRHTEHYRTGNTWSLYPLYDFAHCLSDLIEGITHSICTLEFENNRELYDWIIEAVGAVDPATRPHQTEFARLNLTYTVMSKRKLLELVEKKHVAGWDDPRMPTIAGLRRRGITPEALRDFAERVGVAKNNSTVELALFEHVIREDLNLRAPRVLAVLRPLKVVLENWPADEVEPIDAPYWPADVGKPGSRALPFARELYIDHDDFLESPPKDWHRLAPGREVRLRHAYVIKCESVVKDPKTGEVIELRCSVDRATRSGEPAGRKVKGTIQWVSAAHALDAEVRLYDRLFSTEAPGASGDPLSELNPASLVTLTGCKLEPSLAQAKAEERFQFERLGFFFVDPIDSKAGHPVFNRTVALKDSWSRSTKVEPKSEPAKASDKAEAKPAPKAAEPKVEAELSPAAVALRDTHGIGEGEARILAGDEALRAFFDAAVATGASAKAVANWVVNDVRRELKAAGAKGLPFGGDALGELCALIEAGTISGKIAKEVFAEMVKTGGRPKAIVAQRGIEQIADTGAIEAAVTAVVNENADMAARYRAGNANLLGAFVGLVMKKTGGKASPKLVNELLKQKLG